MKKTLFIAIAVAICCITPATAQTEKELIAAILAYKQCYAENSTIPPQEREIKIDGKVRRTYVELNYGKANFNVSDRDELREMSYMLGGNAAQKSFSIADYKSIGDVFNPDQIDYLQTHYYNRPQTFHILGHGVVDADGSSLGTVIIDNEEVTPEGMAAAMIELLDLYHVIIDNEDKPFTVVLHSCRAGGDEDSFATKLSQTLSKQAQNIYVVAAPGDIYPSIEEVKSGYYNEKIALNETEALNPDYKGMRWNVFNGGGLVGKGDTDFDRTIDLIESGQMTKK